MSRKILSGAVQQALFASAVPAAALALGCLANPAAAQTAAPPPNQKKPQTLQTIVVTGSHIRRVDLETDNPVVAVTAQQIQATGKLTVGSVIQDLPVITGGIQNPSVNNGGGSGSTLVGLRGLGASRTLVLVDGQRVIGSPSPGSGGAVDLNTIPVAAIERIEVLTSGASAIYGSDAIGGVINIILKSNYQGAQFQGNYGISDHGDGQRKGASFIFGQTSDKGSILAGVSYQKFDEISQSSRKFSANALSTSGTSNGRPKFIVGGSSFALRDFLSVSGALATKFGCPSTATSAELSLNTSVFAAGTSPTAPGDYHCYSKAAGDAYNFAAVNLLLTPQERTNAFFKGVYHLSDNVDFFATVYHNKTSAGFQLAPAVFGTPTVAGQVISQYSYYNPFGVNFNAQTGNLYRVRMVPAGDRAEKNGVTTDEVMTGFKGDFNLGQQNWQWDIGYNYGHTSVIQNHLGLPNQDDLLPGLGPSMLDPATGQVVCVTTPGNLATIISGCTPWDPFNLNSPSAKAAIAAAAAPSLVNVWDIDRTIHADANGGIFDLPAGTAQLAVGVSYRKEYTDNVAGPLLLINPATFTCTLGSQCTAHLQGGFNVKEAYAEMLIPLLKDLPFVYGLNITIADRYSKYSDFGSTSNWKVGMEYRPTNDLLLRGTIAKVFRAPTIGDIFGAPVSSAPFLSSDPCDGITAPNPACVGVPTNGTFKNVDTPNVQQLSAVNEGFKAAGFVPAPELGKSFDFGAVYSPNFAPGLSGSVDFWRIYLNNTITTIGVQSVLNLCFNGVTVYCPFIQRVQTGASAGQIIHAVQPTANLGRLDIKGVDLSADYRLPSLPFGQFSVGVNATYMSEVKIQTAPGNVANQVVEGAGLMGWFGSTLQSVCPFSAGGLCFYPRTRAQGTLNWQLGPWSAGWRTRYISRFRMADTTGNIEGLDQFGAYVYNDLNVGYNIEPINTMVQVGVDNVFDKQPPLLGGNFTLNANTDPEDFDVIGRFYWARVTVKF